MARTSNYSIQRLYGGQLAIKRLRRQQEEAAMITRRVCLWCEVAMVADRIMCGNCCTGHIAQLIHGEAA